MISKKNKFLILPGMNQSQEVFNSLLSQSFFISYYKDSEHLPFREIFYQVDEALSLMAEDGIIIAHSYGALILIDYFKKRGEVSNSFRTILIGPAFKARFSTTFLRFLPSRLRLPSLNSRRFRVRSFCYVEDYQRLANLQNAFAVADLEFLGIDFSIVYDPRDELVDTSFLESLPFAKEIFSKDFPRHLYFDFIEKLK
ncbi:hypothetical protein [Bacteriovorax sp. Seq25_V]|uniref:hypothetical protein n=1 Tax=Bacteriovorax sp. Seq25_V TaxID=1201288 RepID=UPI000409A1BD|nr:hypothetical protein [Bacteriovorax sp. Seq25_V]